MRETKSQRILREIDELKIELERHQNRCKHKRATFENCGDTGNWSKSDDRYWEHWTCPTCLKKWIENDRPAWNR